jgi:hypothetical protein
MAGEIGHVVYGARVLTYLGDTVSDPRFWVGTLFPDIRHLGVVSRHRTHPRDISLHTLAGTTDFATGMRVHAWVDATRDTYLSEQNVKESLPWHPFVPHALKLLEDDLLYDSYDDWDVISRLLNKTHEEERTMVEDEHAIAAWHEILRHYFKSKPTDASRAQLAVGIGLSAVNAREINSLVKRLRENKIATEVIQGFWHYLEDLLR